MSENVQTPPTAESSSDPIDKDFDCFCLGRQLCNVPPKTVIAALFTLVGIIISTVLVILDIGRTIFIAILASLVTLWVPSPIQSSKDRKDVIEHASLLQSTYGNQLFGVNRQGRYTALRPPTTNANLV